MLVDFILLVVFLGLVALVAWALNKKKATNAADAEVASVVPVTEADKIAEVAVPEVAAPIVTSKIEVTVIKAVPEVKEEPKVDPVVVPEVKEEPKVEPAVVEPVVVPEVKEEPKVDPVVKTRKKPGPKPKTKSKTV